jgi:S-adenosylmethionine hydrolase
VPIEELGPPLDPDGLVDLDLPKPVIADGAALATVLYIDSFGNMALNLTRDDVERLGIESGTRVELEHAGEQYYAVMARTFADARPGDVILYEDRFRNMSIAISRGSAARMLHASPNHRVRVQPVVGRSLRVR